MKKSINSWWYSGIAILTTILVSLVSWESIYFKANLALVNGVLFFIRSLLLRFELITVWDNNIKHRKQFYIDVFLAIVLLACALFWLKDPDSSIGFFILLLGLFIKIFLEDKLRQL